MNDNRQIETNKSILIIAALILSPLVCGSYADYKPLKPQDQLRRLYAPYSMQELNCYALNYCENLFDKRVNLISYTHLNYDIPSWDAWHLHFPDDNARLIESLVYEDQYSPVVRLELVRRLTKGIMKARYPGTRAYYSFRHRNDGKTFLIFEDEDTNKLRLSTWGDYVMGYVKTGFTARYGKDIIDIEDCEYADTPEGAGRMSVARIKTDENGIVVTDGGASRYWNESPFVFEREFTCGTREIDFTGKYWFSNEDMPPEFAFSAAGADSIDITIGDHMINFGSSWKDAESFIHLPDRKTVYSSKADGNISFDNPDFNYFILRKGVNWTGRGYSMAMLVIFDKRPQQMKAAAEGGYGEIKLTYDKENSRAGGRVWICPFDWINHNDMDYVFSNAESFLKTGKLMHNGYPSQQIFDNIPAGLAAGAYLLAKYGDPSAQTALIQAEAAADAILLPELDGMTLDHRVFSEARAAAWMIRAGKLTENQRLVDKYTPWLQRVMKRMLSAESSYDGSGWVSGWRHFYATRAVWLAYEATENPEYLEAYQRAMDVYDIDKDGIYRNGEKMASPGDADETYFGSLPLGAWGHAGMLDKADMLINLEVPAGQKSGVSPETPLKELWHDGGAGPWTQDDAQPNFAGFCLRGLNIPQKAKTFTPLASFPLYDEQGNVTATYKPMVNNPYLPDSGCELLVRGGENIDLDYSVTEINFKPGWAEEKQFLVQDGGELEGGIRKINYGDKTPIYKFDAAGAANAAVDMVLQGNALTVDVSPDGKRWFQRLNTWSDESVKDSIDVSFLTGSRDELIKIDVITPSGDASVLKQDKNTQLLREHCRYVGRGGHFIYELDTDGLTECHLEFVMGNGYNVEFSADGEYWNDGLNERFKEVRDGAKTVDAAWLRIADVTPYLNENGSIYVRFSNNDSFENYQNTGAFLRRLTVYGIFDSDSVYVRFGNCPFGRREQAALSGLTFRKWSKKQKFNN
ncbi:hypothetical protein SMSP2_01964 [Limihaloglobus sulfuriphilus]|uniref:Uncharacterized protein n=1 Tax=Limihaloglobus sulfuriphilus TaxID=1851148 RepID=A0A1Q2MGB0_9BACT|nr:hypothetical protein [Limihaloglobus sulfuriphilus]AQQ71588.1 hypothetical protein SMSP2_01964 [Limihaloglobus sulfuriphilus]